MSINDKRSEDEFTGTAILSWKATDDLLVYSSFARGYKAGGFNLDRSALKSPIGTFAASGGAQALTGRLQFDPELVDSYEIGAKFSNGPFGLSVSAFRSDFSNFQLNTFNGTVFLVQSINGCGKDLAGADRDQNLSAAGSNFNAAAATTGACAASDVGYGVRAEGVELEASLVPARNFRMAAGLTYANTSYRQNLVGTHAKVAVCQKTVLCGTQAQAALGFIQHDEVIASTLHLGKRNSHGGDYPPWSGQAQSKSMSDANDLAASSNVPVMVCQS